MDNIQSYFLKQYSLEGYLFKNLNTNHFYYDSDNRWNKHFYQNLKSFLIKNNIIPEKSSLEQVHDVIPRKYLEVDNIGGQSNKRALISSIMFDFIESQQDSYFEFLRWIHQNIVKENFYFQAIPTIRVHLPGVHQVKYPVWHSDCFLGHSPKEINVWFGLTHNNHSDFWVHTLEQSKVWLEKFNYTPKLFTDISYGDNTSFDKKGFEGAHEVQNMGNCIFFFDSRCIHSAQQRTQKDWTTKFSIDIRMILVKDFEWLIIDGKPLFKGTGRQQSEFRPGAPFGYHEKPVSDI